MSPTPIVVIGRNPAIASAVRKGVMPEYDVIHVVLSVEQGLVDLPLLLSNPSRIIPNSSENIGSRNYGARPLAVAAGGGYDDVAFGKLKEVCKDVEEGIVWMRVDMSKAASMPSFTDRDAYGLATAKRVKAKLKELGVGEKEVEDGVYLF